MEADPQEEAQESAGGRRSVRQGPEYEKQGQKTVARESKNERSRYGKGRQTVQRQCSRVSKDQGKDAVQKGGVKGQGGGGRGRKRCVAHLDLASLCVGYPQR